MMMTKGFGMNLLQEIQQLFILIIPTTAKHLTTEHHYRRTSNHSGLQTPPNTSHIQTLEILEGHLPLQMRVM
jgi:hypothetical protein